MKVKLVVFFSLFSSFIFSSEQMMSMLFLILSSVVTCENNSFALCVENKKNKSLVLETKSKNKSSDKCFKNTYFKKIKNNIQQPTKRNF